MTDATLQLIYDLQCLIFLQQFAEPVSSPVALKSDHSSTQAVDFQHAGPGVERPK